jgi:dGTPase
MGLGGFQHNEQSARVVEVLENDGQGLNLTWEVVDGIRHHSGDDASPATLEAEIVHLADRIAYVNHDIDDALRAGLITQSDLPRGPVKLLGQTGSQRIDTLVHDLVDASAAAWMAASSDAPLVAGGDAFGATGIVQTPDVGGAMAELREFLFATVYVRAQEQSGGERIRQLLTDLMDHFLCHPEALPAPPRGTVSATGNELVRAVTDHIAGMTDRYAQRVYLELFMPRCWGDL